MRAMGWAAALAFTLAGCEPAAPHDYPSSARATFARTCPSGDALCDCTWDRITRTMTHDEYREALARFRREGLMDPRVAHARTYCLEHGR